MTAIALLLKGILLGIIVSVPMGPVGVLCIQRTVNRGKITGIISGLGAAFADSIYSFLAAFGVSFITDFLQKNQITFQLIGIIALLFLGIQMIQRDPIKQFRYKNFGARGATHIKNFASVFFITLSNPLTILFFGTAITMMGIFDNKFTTLNGLMLVAGVFAGAGLWWFGLSSIVNRFRKKFRLRKLVYLNYISGAIIIGLTLIIGIRLFFI